MTPERLLALFYGLLEPKPASGDVTPADGDESRPPKTLGAGTVE